MKIKVKCGRVVCVSGAPLVTAAMVQTEVRSREITIRVPNDFTGDVSIEFVHTQPEFMEKPTVRTRGFPDLP